MISTLALDEDDFGFEGIDMSKIQLIGRWEDQTSNGSELSFGKSGFISDWPCSALKFNIELADADESLKIRWYGVRSKV